MLYSGVPSHNIVSHHAHPEEPETQFNYVLFLMTRQNVFCEKTLQQVHFHFIVILKVRLEFLLSEHSP